MLGVFTGLKMMTASKSEVSLHNRQASAADGPKFRSHTHSLTIGFASIRTSTWRKE